MKENGEIKVINCIPKAGAEGVLLAEPGTDAEAGAGSGSGEGWLASTVSNHCQRGTSSSSDAGKPKTRTGSGSPLGPVTVSMGRLEGAILASASDNYSDGRLVMKEQSSRMPGTKKLKFPVPWARQEPGLGFRHEIGRSDLRDIWVLEAGTTMGCVCCSSPLPSYL